MAMKTYPITVADGKVYAEVTLKDVVERCDVSGLPMLAEIKRLYDENAKLRELVRDMCSYVMNREMELCNACVEADGDYAGCNACDEYDGACGIAKKRFEELYSDRMLELGVEV